MTNNIDMSEINNIYNWLKRIGPSLQYGCYTAISYPYTREIEDALTRITVKINNTFPEYSQRISILKRNLFMDNLVINICLFCQLTECIHFLILAIEKDKKNDQWRYIHKKFHNDVMNKFLHGFYSDAVFTATNILMERLKTINHQLDPSCPDIDGSDIIGKLFSNHNPKILFYKADTKTGENIQKGYVDFFRGWIFAIRNKNAHPPIEQLNDINAFRELNFISILMTALDNRVSPQIFDDE